MVRILESIRPVERTQSIESMARQLPDESQTNRILNGFQSLKDQDQDHSSLRNIDPN